MPTERKRKIFMSYAREDWPVAERLYADLTQRGINVWVDKKELLPGQKWKTVISQTIRDSSHFLALFSEHSITSRGYFQRELKKAMDVLEELPEYEIYFIPVRLDDCEPADEKLRDIHWADLFPDYDTGLRQILRVLTPENDRARPEALFKETGAMLEKKKDKALRNTPITVSDEEFKNTFGLDEKRRPLKYVQNDYKDNGDGTITDHATGLIWQQSGSDDWLTIKQAEEYVRDLNQKRFAGYSDWRLPTIPELMSLLEPEKNPANNLYINLLFDKKQNWCMSSDGRSSGGRWSVYFASGSVGWSYASGSVRSVRAGQ